MKHYPVNKQVSIGGRASLVMAYLLTKHTDEKSTDRNPGAGYLPDSYGSKLKRKVK